MPWAPKKPCNHPGCAALVHGRWCERHQPPRRPEAPRPSAAARGYGAKWRAASKGFLAHHPLCGCGAAATVVDHDPPHKGDMAKFWNRATWKPRCARCHNVKTAREDGGFGNPQRRGEARG